MNFELKTLDLAGAASAHCDVLLLPVAQTGIEALKAGTGTLPGLLASALEHGDFSAEAGKQLHLYQSSGVEARRVLLLGVGQGSVRELRDAIQGAAPYLKAEGVRHAVLCLSALPAVQEAHIAHAVQSLHDACYQYQLTKSKAKPLTLGKLTLAVPDKAAVATAFAQGQAIALGQQLAKEWGNRPANHATPTDLAKAAQTLAQAPQMSCKIHGPKDVAKLGMHAFMAVAQGSKEPLQFIELHYQGAGKAQAPVVLVGKGITFDTGGISLKPAAAMDEMKFDMCGAASVLGVFQALAELQPQINVVGLIPACENMPDGGAVKPGDVITSMDGQTIEILNTDAEGRLVLCDALSYAKRFAPSTLIDIATLTGACVIALGGVRSGLYASCDTLAQELQQAGEAAQDLCWRMPLDEDYAEGLKSNFADMGNVAGRAAGSITAAKFLQRFVGDARWAHLDIAGTAWKEGKAKGATGRPVGLLVQYLLGQQAVAPEAKPGPKKAGSKKTAAKK
ncbi:MAG: leucyl aminopeptidase [Comamonas sp.]|nr:leucyl aminopeptidase [Comamonas sp.]